MLRLSVFLVIHTKTIIPAGIRVTYDLYAEMPAVARFKGEI